MFCWSEIGAEHIGVIQSLVTNCKMQGVDPYIYLTDVLQRIAQHPSKETIDPTSRVWKDKFTVHALTSDLHVAV